MSFLPEYEHTDDSPELAETAECAMLYIMEGDNIHAIYDLRGLLVFGVIRALRENDELLYGSETPLTEEQQARLQEVEDQVDTAVEGERQYFPFGHNREMFRIDGKEYHALSGNPSRSQRVRESPNKRRSRLRMSLADEREKREVHEPGPVTTHNIDKA